MSNEEKEKKVSLNLVAWSAIILWVIRTVFDVGALYATSQNKEYVDKKTETLRLEWKGDLKDISDKLDKLIQEKMK